MTKQTAGAAYRTLDPESLLALIAELRDVRALLGAKPDDWRVREVGDGNLNLVFIVEGPDGSVCIKQALPYVRAAGPSWPMSLERAFFENSYYRAVAPHVGGLIPKIHHYDPDLYCTIMERLSPHIILRQGLIAGRRYTQVARDIGEYVARACYFTSDFAQPFEHKMDGAALFAGNKALIHGDLHSGSVMVTESDSRVIDPEFAFYGPIGFDLGAFFGNLLLSWYSQPGHATADDDRAAYQDWILEQARTFWHTFRDRFMAPWTEHAGGDVFPASMFSAPEEAGALTMARLLLTQPEQFNSVDDVTDAMPRMASKR